MVQEHIRLSLNIAYELTRQKNVGEKIDFDTLPYTLARISLLDIEMLAGAALGLTEEQTENIINKVPAEIQHEDQ